MKLLQQYLLLLTLGWKGAFCQRRTLHRAIEHALALPCVLGRRTISRTICALGRQHQDWTADYRIFSRRSWDPERLFDPVFREYLQRCPDGPVPVALDDTTLKKAGKCIPGAFWQYDHMSPPFHRNLLFGLRFIQASILFPHYREGDFPARSYPIRFSDAPAVKKPTKRASEEQMSLYRLQKKQVNLSTLALAVLKSARQSLDQAGAQSRPILTATDGSYCNRTFFTADLQGIRLVSRCFHPRVGAQGLGRPLEKGPLPLCRETPQNPLQGAPRRPLAGRRQAKEAAPDRHRPPALPEIPQVPPAVPAACLSALHRPGVPGLPFDPDLSGPLADRGQPPR